MCPENPGNPIQVQTYRRGIEYPADKSDLIRRARQNDAPDNIMDTLRSLPEQEYGQPPDVTKAISRRMRTKAPTEGETSAEGEEE